jgi:hypothetical protein
MEPMLSFSQPTLGNARQEWWRRALRVVPVGGAAVGLGGLCAQLGLLGPILLVGLVGGIAVSAIVFGAPRLGFWATLVVAIIGLGVKRYVPVPMGLTVDVLLTLTWIGLVVPVAGRLDWHKANRPAVWGALLWMGYITFQLLNPEAASHLAWAYAMRGVGLHFALVVPLVLLLLDRRRDLDWFLTIWFVLSVLGTLNGLRQQFIGLDPFEWQWLRSGAAVQHILFGKLRIFSFFSDAGQFGAAQGHVAVVAGIMTIGRDLSWRRRLFYGLVALCGVIGLFISGTRGAMAVPFFGGVTYLVLSKNWRAILLGVAAMAMAFGFFMYTSIGSSVYQIQRFRDALQRGSDTPSMQVRLRNQARLARYMKADPVRYAIGGGIGSVGSWGQRFSPGTWLARFPPDSWYVRLWAETGTVGLGLYLGLWILLMGYGAVLVWRVEDPQLRQALIGLHAGIMGILVASYGNQVLGQLPTGILVYASLAYLSMAPRLADDRPSSHSEQAAPTPS